jgi:hypothetical protein
MVGFAFEVWTAEAPVFDPDFRGTAQMGKTLLSWEVLCKDD